jgi:hypothetical protein
MADQRPAPRTTERSLLASAPVRRAIIVIGLIVGAIWLLDPLGEDELPEATDAEWVAEQRSALEGKRVTTGRFKSTEHETLEITSGWEPISDRITEVLRDSPHFPPFGAGKPSVATDVETKAAMMTRAEDAAVGVVVINHPGGVCGGAMGCRTAVPAILPDDARLFVWEPGNDEPVVLTGKDD